MSISIPTAFKLSIPIEYGQLQNVVDWCERNCMGEWRYMEDHRDQWHSWTFLFEDERDYCAFLLWQK